MKHSFLIIVSFFCLSILEAHSQSGENTFPFTCTIIDSLSKHPVALCHVYDESQRKGLVADTNGSFITLLSAGDTLVFIALGYLGQIYVIQENDTAKKKIKLYPRIYEIEPVTVGLPKTYNDLKKAILAHNTKKDDLFPDLPQYNPYKTPELLDTNVLYSAGFMIMHPVSGLYYRYSKEEQSKRKVMYLEEQELKQPAVDKKFNRDLVSEITGLKDDDLTNFIGYCNFSFNYLYSATPLEIIETIYRKYDQYKICCYKPDENKNTESEKH